MSKDFRNLFTDIGIVVVVLLLVLPFTCSRIDRLDDARYTRETDTVYIHDTIRIVEPKIVKEEVVKYVYVTLPKADKNIPISNELDSTSNLTSNLTQDSAKVVIPITERTYEDSTYKAVVRGYNPELVSLDIYNSTKTITITKTKQPKVVVGIGPYAGFGNKGFNYGIAVNVSMPIWSW